MLGGDGPIVKALDRLFLGAISAATVGGSEVALGLIDGKLEVARLSRELISGLRDRFNGLSRYNRTQRLEAAHAIIVTVAFFEALEGLNLPFSTGDVHLTHEDVLRVSHPRAIHHLVNTPFWLPAMHRPFEDNLHELETHYGTLSTRYRAFLSGLGLWDRLDETQRARTNHALKVETPPAAVLRYAALYRQLCVDFPEFALWADLGQQHATRDVVRSGFAELEAALTGLAPGRVPTHQLQSIAKANRAPLNEPIYRATDLPARLRMPTLEAAYVTPSFRTMETESAANLSVDDRWIGAVRNDLAAFLAAYVTSSRALAAPLVVLGQPGAGKSVLTKMVAAQLPAGQFLPIRVPLRSVPAEAPIQEQIEHAVKLLTHERVDWADLARSAAESGVVPVVLLDGLDELLQATGVHQANYLTEVARFQREEQAQDRAVAVIVTTRTAVADRCRLPEDSLALRLEPFDYHQIAAWLAVWNSANESYFRRERLRPLPPETATTQWELASQPLLLFMLALYDADKNALQAETETLAKAELYRRLLTRFAVREVGKHHPRLSEDGVAEAVDGKLLRLAIAAFGMLNRGRQWVTSQELDRDLAALLPSGPGSSEGFTARITAAEEVIGGFFFVHKAQAEQADNTLKTYEFLHATFGEYLVAFLLNRVIEQLRAQSGPTVFGGTHLQDGMLYALTSFSVLTDRAPVLGFLDELMGSSGEHRSLLLRLFRQREHRTDHSFSDYQPQPHTMIRRQACFSVNMVLLVAIAHVNLSAKELFGSKDDPVPVWRRLALLWKSALLDEEWQSLIGNLLVYRTMHEKQRDLQLGVRRVARLRQAPEPDWFQQDDLSDFYGEQSFLCLPSLELASHGTYELGLTHVPGAVRSLMDIWSGDDSSSDAYMRAANVHAIARLTSKARLFQTLARDIAQMPSDEAKAVLTHLADLAEGPRDVDQWVICALEVIARDSDALTLRPDALRDAVVARTRWNTTLVELGFALAAPPTESELAEVREADPILWHRARRAFNL